MKLGHVVVLGRGKVGQGIARALRVGMKAGKGDRRRGAERGAGVSLVKARGTRRLRADTVLLAIPDASLSHVAMILAEPGALRSSGLRRPPIVLHLSGLRDASVLAPLAEAGFAVGAMHPLVSFASAASPPRLKDTYFAISTKKSRRGAMAEECSALIARAVGAHALVSARGKGLQGPTYHAAAALLANGAVALAAHASAILEDLGVGRRARMGAISGLLGSVADNVRSVGVPAALTGPIARGDAAAVALHLRALEPRARAAYLAIARLIVPVAKDLGLHGAPLTTIAHVLDAAQAGLARPRPRPRSREKKTARSGKSEARTTKARTRRRR